jgi:hypothetical protein
VVKTECDVIPVEKCIPVHSTTLETKFEQVKQPQISMDTIDVCETASLFLSLSLSLLAESQELSITTLNITKNKS